MAALRVVELRPGDHGANGNDEQRDEEAEPVEPGVLPGDDEPDDEQDAADEEHPRRIAGLAVRGALDVRGRGVHALTRARGPRRVDRHPAVSTLDRAVDGLGRQRPEEEVGDDACAAGERQHDEADPGQAQVPAEVLRQPGAHAATMRPSTGRWRTGRARRSAARRAVRPAARRGRHAHILSHRGATTSAFRGVVPYFRVASGSTLMVRDGLSKEA